MASDKFSYTSLQGLTETLLASGNSLRVKTEGNSMYPFIKKGAMATVIKVDFYKIRLGDIVVFKKQNTYVAHRVIKIKKNNLNRLLICKGDARKRADCPFGFEEYVGKVITIETDKKTKNMESLLYKLSNPVLAYISPYVRVFYKLKKTIKKFFFLQ